MHCGHVTKRSQRSVEGPIISRPNSGRTEHCDTFIESVSFTVEMLTVGDEIVSESPMFDNTAFNIFHAQNPETPRAMLATSVKLKLQSLVCSAHDIDLVDKTARHEVVSCSPADQEPFITSSSMVMKDEARIEPW